MKLIAKGKVYDTDNPKWVIVAEYTKPLDVDIIYLTTTGEYVRYTKVILETDVPTPPKEKMELLEFEKAYEILSNFRGVVYYDKFPSA